MQEVDEMRVLSLGWENPLEEGMATHSSILAWRIPGTEEPVYYSPLGPKELETTEATEHTCMHTYTMMKPVTILKCTILWHKCIPNACNYQFCLVSEVFHYPRWKPCVWLACAQLLQSFSDSLRPHGSQPARLTCPWDSPGKILEWVAIPSSRGSYQPRDQTHFSYISCTAGRVITEPPGKHIWSVFFPHSCLPSVPGKYC